MRRIKASDKITQKMTRDGLVEENHATGEVTNISCREAETEYAAHEERPVEPQASKRTASVHGRTRKPVKQDTTFRKKQAAKETALPLSENPPEAFNSAPAGSVGSAKGRDASSRLSFTSTEKKPKGRLPHNPAARPATVARAAVHQQVYDVEQDNVGVEAGHRGEMLLEHEAIKTGHYARKTIHSHRMSRLQEGFPAAQSTGHAEPNRQTQRAVPDSAAQTGSNPVSRYIQKKRLQRQSAKQVRQTEQTMREMPTATRTVVQRAKDVLKDAAAFVGRHHKGVLILLGVGAGAFMLVSSASSLSTVLSSSAGSIFSTSYLSEDEDMLAAEAAYVEMEAALQEELDQYAQRHPGYDEYRFNLDDIEHDPYVLISILSALHEGIFTIEEVQTELQMLFEKQYILTENVTTETRYRTETRIGSRTVTDPETGEETEEEYEYEVQIPYTYTICTVSLENFNLSHVPIYIMSEDQLSLYAGYMSTLGNREDLFAGNSNASSLREPTYYDIPPEALEDEQFAAIMAEATKYIGYPYVWGGSTPSTSFDCSGYVSWVINHSGWNVGRLGATGLYNICTPVSVSQAKPGDLVFFVGTYNTDGCSHVGIYVGNNMMLHCGDPISYADLSSSYWQAHFFSFGRLP